MNPKIKNILAVIAGIVIGSVVNMAIVSNGGSMIPPPEGVNPEDMESIKANIHLYKAKHFMVPFLAHALGTIVGALVAALIAATHKFKIALGIGAFFLLGGIAAVFMLPGTPIWFILLDLVVAYIPMGFLGGKIAEQIQSKA